MNKQIRLFPPNRFIKCNSTDGYKDVVFVDECIADEVNQLWDKNIHTCGCCCGHNKDIGFIQVVDEDIIKMQELGYEKYIYEDEFGGINRNDAFIPKSKCKC